MNKLTSLLYLVSILLIALGLGLEFEGTSSMFGYALAAVGVLYLISAVILHWSNFHNSFWERERGHG